MEEGEGRERGMERSNTGNMNSLAEHVDLRSVAQGEPSLRAPEACACSDFIGSWKCILLFFPVETHAKIIILTNVQAASSS
jgi:hypothetical protein